MAVVVPNIQQDFDDHVLAALTSAWGNDAPGGQWAEDKDTNVKNKYAITREYRTLNLAEVPEMVKGRLASNLGVVILTGTRFLAQPLDAHGKRYGARIEMMLYVGSLSVRQNQLSHLPRTTYLMIRDCVETIIENPFTLNNLSLPIRFQTPETELVDDEVDLQRLNLFIPTAQFTYQQP